MAKGSNNPFPSVLLVEQASTPTTPSAGQARIYVDDTATPLLKFVDDAGTVSTVALSDAAIPVEIGVACSDETTAIAAPGTKTTFRMPYAMTVTGVRASLTGATTTGTVTVDINDGGTSILSTKLTIDATEKTSTTAATPAVISDTALADDAEITIDIDGVGSTVAGAGLKVYLIGTKA